MQNDILDLMIVAVFETIFPYVLKIHITTAILLVALVFYADSLGMAWMRGKVEVLDPLKLRRVHRLMWTGLAVMLVTGPVLFYPFKEYLLEFTPFLIKMSFVAALVINSFFIGKLMHISTTQPFRSLSQRERAPLFISGAISTISWAGAIIAATMLNL